MGWKPALRRELGYYGNGRAVTMLITGSVALVVSIGVFVAAWRYYRTAIEAKQDAMTRHASKAGMESAARRSVAGAFDEALVEALGDETEMPADVAARIRFATFRIADRKLNSAAKLG